MSSKKNKSFQISPDVVIAGVVALLIGLGGGYVIANSESETVEPAAHSHEVDEDMTTSEHSHGDMFMVDESVAPSVKFSVKEDEKSGWNVSLTTENFTFTPESVNGTNVVGEGHAHLYVDGEKISRLYGEDYHYAVDFDGTKTFRVTLNANDHSEYSVDGQVVDYSLEVTHQNHN